MSATAPTPAPTPEERAALVDQIATGLVDLAASQVQLNELAPERSSPAEVDATLQAAHELEAAVGDLRATAAAADEAVAARAAAAQDLRDQIALLRQQRDLAAIELAARRPREPHL